MSGQYGVSLAIGIRVAISKREYKCVRCALDYLTATLSASEYNNFASVLRDIHPYNALDAAIFNNYTESMVLLKY